MILDRVTPLDDTTWTQPRRTHGSATPKHELNVGKSPPTVPGSDLAGACIPQCPRCDYILFGLPANRCPECGNRFDWITVLSEARAPRLPLETAKGWRRMIGGLHTWLLVLFRPVTFARRLSQRSSIGPATLFAIVCLLLAVTGNQWLGYDRWASCDLVGWIAACWFHVECQSVLFLLLDLRRRGWLAQWSSWRKLSLYTTAFVVLDWVAGPPLLTVPLSSSPNFFWVLDSDAWRFLARLPNFRNSQFFPVSWADVCCPAARGVAYHWWMTALAISLFVRLRRKWCVLIALGALPLITVAAVWVGFGAHDVFRTLNSHYPAPPSRFNTLLDTLLDFLHVSQGCSFHP